MNASWYVGAIGRWYCSLRSAGAKSRLLQRGEAYWVTCLRAWPAVPAGTARAERPGNRPTVSEYCVPPYRPLGSDALSGPSWRDQAGFVGEDRQLHTVAHVEFVEAAGDVGLHGGLTEVELVADVGVGLALRDRGDDLALAVGEGVRTGPNPRSRRIRPARNEPSIMIVIFTG